MELKKIFSAIIEKYNRPTVEIIYGYDYEEYPDYAGDTGNERLPATNFYIVDQYTQKICEENQSSQTAKGSYYFGGVGVGLTRDYDNWEKTVIFSEDAKKLCKELSDACAYKSDFYNELDFWLFKSGIEKEDIFNIIVKSNCT